MKALRFILCSLCLAGAAGGCASAPLETRLQSVDPSVRIAAVREIAQGGHEQQVPELIERLNDEDPAVRFAAIAALELITGTRLGYSYAAPAAKRREAVEAWRSYWSGQATGAAGPPGPPDPRAVQPVASPGH